MMVRRSMLRILLSVVALAAVLALAGLAAWGPLLRPAIYARVGEHSTRELIKGIGAYIGQQLSQPALDLAPYIPIRYSDECPYGVNAFLEQEVDPAKVARSLDMMQAAGFHFVRQEFPWEDIEISGKGDFWDHKWDVSAWAKYDRIVDMAVERGLQLIVRLDHPPAWSRAAGNSKGYSAPPDRLEDYGDLVEAVVSRYRGKVRYYQIWNEPNIYPEWGEQDVDAAAYTRLLQEGYRRAKAADPNCVILSAGLAQTIEQGPRNQSDVTYLQQMYDAGARGYFDVLSVMPYGIWTGPTDHRLGPMRTNFARPQLIRAIMVKNGDADKPIWAMEIGWNAMPPDLPGTPIYGRVTRERQAQYAVEAYERAQREWPWMGVMNYWFFKRASDTEKDQPFYYFGLLEPDFSAWPVYTAVSDYANRPPALYPGYHQEGNSALQYSGAWTGHDDPAAVLGQYRRGSSGAELKLSFWGSELDLVTFGQAGPASLEASVDGRPARAVPIEVQGHPALRLARYDTAGLHSVTIRVSTGDGLAIDGLLVRRDERRACYVAGGIAAGLLALVGGSAVGLRLRASRRPTGKG